MEVLIHPCSQIKGEITIPPSKSYSQRVLACALILKGKTKIYNLGKSDDEIAALEILNQCGEKIIYTENYTEIESTGIANNGASEINCNESGLSSRMFTPIFSNSNNKLAITGEGSLLKRPMHFFDSVFKELNVSFTSNQGYLPFNIQGSLHPKSIFLDGSLSSQFITGIIYAYVSSPYLRDEILTVLNPTSIPYINLSLEVLEKFGVKLFFENNQIQFQGPYLLKETSISIEGDWSSASFFLVAAAIHGEINIKNLNINSNQADRAILEVLEQFGADIEVLNNLISVKKSKLKSFVFDATNCPDLFPPLAVLASFGNEKSIIKGVFRLFSKESNRALAIQKELGKMGAKIEIIGDEMHIFPLKQLNSTTINPHGDHRIAMAASIMALKAPNPSKINDSKVVNKSFPEFYDFLNSVRF